MDSTQSSVEGKVIDTITHAAGSDIGLRREENQDSFGVIETEHSKLFIVADGMGGVRGGKVASQLVVDVMTELLKKRGSIREEDIATAAAHANTAVFERGLDEPGLAGMGTTLVGISFVEEQMYIVNVGDSRAYRLRSGQIQQLTEDHTLVSELLRSGAITESQVKNHPVSHMLTRSLGPTPIVEIDCYEGVEKAAAGDSYLLCSDGLYNLVSEEEMLYVVSSNSPEEAVTKLIETANSRGGTDNITIILIGLGEKYPNKLDPEELGSADEEKDLSDTLKLKKTTTDELQKEHEEASAVSSGNNGHVEAGESINPSVDPSKLSQELSTDEESPATSLEVEADQAEPVASGSDGDGDLNAGPDGDVSQDGEELEDTLSDIPGVDAVNGEPVDTLYTATTEALEQPLNADTASTMESGHSEDRHPPGPSSQSSWIMLLLAIIAFSVLGYISGQYFSTENFSSKNLSTPSLPDGYVSSGAMVPQRVPQGEGPENSQGLLDQEKEAPIRPEQEPAPVSKTADSQVGNENLPATALSKMEGDIFGIEGDSESDLDDLDMDEIETVEIDRSINLRQQGEKLAARIGKLESQYSRFDEPMSGEVGQQLTDKGRSIQSLELESANVKSRREEIELEMSRWAERKKRLAKSKGKTEMKRLVRELSKLGYEDIKVLESKYRRSVARYSNLGDELSYSPNNEDIQRKMQQLLDDRLIILEEMTSGVEKLIQEEINGLFDEMTQTMEKAAEIKETISANQKEVKIYNILLKGTAEEKEEVQSQLGEELKKLKKQYSELMLQMESAKQESEGLAESGTVEGVFTEQVENGQVENGTSQETPPSENATVEFSFDR